MENGYSLPLRDIPHAAVVGAAKDEDRRQPGGARKGLEMRQLGRIEKIGPKLHEAYTISFACNNLEILPDRTLRQ